MTQSGSKLARQLDDILDGGDLSENDAERLAELLRPAEGGGVWPDIEDVLRVAEHGAVEPLLSRGDLPEVLDDALSEALRALMPMLGERAFGPTYKLARSARRRLGAESRKFETVREHLEDDVSRERTVRVLRNYLETTPAPIFVSRMRRQFPKLLCAAEESAIDEEELDELTSDTDLVESLLDLAAASLEADALAERLRELEARVDPDEMLILAALDSSKTAHRAVGAALAAWKGLDHRAPMLLGKAMRGEAPTELLAITGARLAPLTARNVFGQLLAEASWGNPEEPEAELTAERSTAILVARCILPHIGSPLEALDEVELSEEIDFEGLDQIPERVEAGWRQWRELAENEESGGQSS